jgi:hypothetical protein
MRSRQPSVLRSPGGIVGRHAARDRVAPRTDFYDRPRDYHKHGAPTPFLGGAAVLVGFLVAAVAVGG